MIGYALREKREVQNSGAMDKSRSDKCCIGKDEKCVEKAKMRIVTEVLWAALEKQGRAMDSSGDE